MADGLTYLVTEQEKEDMEVILESGDYSPNDWERKFLADMLSRNEDYVSINRRTSIDKILKKFNFS